MKGKQYFQNFYGALYEYFLLPYIYGTGKLKDETASYSIEWELVVDFKGEHRLFVSKAPELPFLEKAGPYMKKYSLEGEVSSGESITVTECYFQRGNGITIEGQTLSEINIMPQDIENQNLRLKSYIRNLNPEKVTETLDFAGRSWVLRRSKNIDSLKRLIQNGYFGYAVLSSIECELPSLADIQAASSDRDDLLSVLALSILDLPLSPYVELLGETGKGNREAVGFIVRNQIAYSYYPYRTIGEDCPGGLQKLLSDSESYFRANSGQSLRQLIQYSVMIVHQKELELRWTVLILAFEYLCNYHFRNDLGMPEAKISSFKNLEQKMKYLNKSLRFIPNKYLSSFLREHIRNPLFHSGELLSMDFRELDTLLDEYLDIYLRCVFRIVNYTGSFKAFSNGFSIRPV